MEWPELLGERWVVVADKSKKFMCDKIIGL